MNFVPIVIGTIFKYPEIILIPIIMEAEKFIAGRSHKDNLSAYYRHFSPEVTDLNPLWMDPKKKNTGITILFHVGVLAITGIMIHMAVLAQYETAMYGTRYGENLFNVAIGFMVGYFTINLGNHLYTHSMNKFMEKNPQIVSGKVELKYLFLSKNAQYRRYIAILPMTGILLITRNTVVLGAFIALVLTLIPLGFWRWRYNKS